MTSPRVMPHAAPLASSSFCASRYSSSALITLFYTMREISGRTDV